MTPRVGQESRGERVTGTGRRGQVFSLGSPAFAAPTATLGEVGVSEVNSDLATLIRTGVILVVAAGIVTARGEWEPPGRCPGSGR